MDTNKKCSQDKRLTTSRFEGKCVDVFKYRAGKQVLYGLCCIYLEEEKVESLFRVVSLFHLSSGGYRTTGELDEI